MQTFPGRFVNSNFAFCLACNSEQIHVEFTVGPDVPCNKTFRGLGETPNCIGREEEASIRVEKGKTVTLDIYIGRKPLKIWTAF